MTEEEQRPDPIGELVREARSRIEGLEGVECARDGEAYVITVSRGGLPASARLKARFWQEYLDSGRTDNCHCIDHFFDHLDRSLAR